VIGIIKPTSDSNIKIEVWLPLTTWNGKFVAVGNMGWAGQISERNFLAPLQSGYAVAATDTGHEGNSGAFIIGHPERLIDFAYRADHEMTLKTKALIKAFYGVAPKHSYWVSCSLGGEEALIEAKRYPEDYDGVVAGSPINPVTLFNSAQLWPAWISMKYPDEVIPAAKFTMIHEAVLKACASPTGIKQGVVDDPVNCHFDPVVLQCKGADAPDCLTAGQVDMMHKLYQGPVNPRTGESIFPGVLPGVEIQWAQNGMTGPSGVAVDLYKYAVFQDPNWDWKTMDYDTAIAKAVKEINPLLVVEPNLNEFLKQGDKLMITIGGAETHSARDIVGFYEKVLKNAGPGHENQVRLFVNPGQGHCGGGAGCDTYDKVGTIDQWVESGKAPDQILSSKVTGGKTIRTRPLCAYPTVARYKGTGDEDDAASFVCGK
jgi:feruloyl esterase